MIQPGAVAALAFLGAVIGVSTAAIIRRQAPERAAPLAPAQHPRLSPSPGVGAGQPGPEQGAPPSKAPAPGHPCGPVVFVMEVRKGGCIRTWNPVRKWRVTRPCPDHSFNEAEWEARYRA